MLSIHELHDAMVACELAEEAPDEALLRDYVALVGGLLSELERLSHYLEILTAQKGKAHAGSV